MPDYLRTEMPPRKESREVNAASAPTAVPRMCALMREANAARD